MDLDIGNNTKILDKGKIDIKRLDKNQYTMSLLKEGLRYGALCKDNVIDIQIQIMDILKELIMKYTGGESTSVTINVSEGLLNSILYSLDFYMLRFGNSQDALKNIKQKPVKEIYEEGITLLGLCVDETKKLYKKMKENRLKLELEAYNVTLDEAIPSFFEKYGVVFEAHNTMASIDYPLVFDDMKVRGISYIKNYLEHLDIETEFCRFFPVEEIIKVLSDFGRMYGINYHIELINIFELLINNSIFSVLSGNNAGQINIQRYQYNILKEKFKGIDLTKLNSLVDEAAKTVIEDLQINNSLLTDYIIDYKKLLVKRILNALENDSLSSLIVMYEEKDKEKYTTAFYEGKRMSEGKFKRLANKILRLHGVMDKINIINSSIHSLQDFIDVLNADCLFGEEFGLLYSSLGDIELATLIKMVFYEEIRDGLIDLSADIISNWETHTEWQEYFIEFIQNCSKEKKQIIGELIDKIDYEEINFI